MAKAGYKVLLIDGDPQGSLAISLGYREPDHIKITLANQLLKIINEEKLEVEELVPPRIKTNGNNNYTSNINESEKVSNQITSNHYRDEQMGWENDNQKYAIYEGIVKENIDYVLGCFNANTTKVKNIKKYPLATLYNAPCTMDGYYRAEVNHDFPQFAR